MALVSLVVLLLVPEPDSLVLLEISSVEGMAADESASIALCSLEPDALVLLFTTGEFGTVKTFVDRELRDLVLVESSLTVSGGFSSSTELLGVLRLERVLNPAIYQQTKKCKIKMIGAMI